MVKPTCINCERSDDKTALLQLVYQNEVKHICPQCLPVLIHKPHLLAGKLPDMEIIPPAEH